MLNCALNPPLCLGLDSYRVQVVDRRLPPSFSFDTSRGMDCFGIYVNYVTEVSLGFLIPVVVSDIPTSSPLKLLEVYDGFHLPRVSYSHQVTFEFTKANVFDKGYTGLTSRRVVITVWDQRPTRPSRVSKFNK